MLGLDSHHVPRLHAQSTEDGSVLFEWILPNLRIGFGIDGAVSQSSWFLVTDKSLDYIGDSGYLASTEVQDLALRLVRFLALHS